MSDEATAGTDNANTSDESQATEAAASEEQGTLLTGGDTEAESSSDDQGGGDQAADDSSEDGGDGDAEVPETYEFTVPEGMELDQAMADAITPVFKDLKLSQDQANALTKVYAERLEAQQQATVEAFNKQLADWAKELKTDSEVGGDAFENNAGVARTAIEKLGSPELKEFLETTGAGNHPALFKFALAVGKLLVEDQPGSGTSSNQANKPDYAKMYPDMPTENNRRV